MSVEGKSFETDRGIGNSQIKIDFDRDWEISEIERVGKFFDPEERDRTSLDFFFDQARENPVLKIEEEKEITQLMASGRFFHGKKKFENLDFETPESEGAYFKLINRNIRLVMYFAKRNLNRGVPFVDLIQEGNMGLMRAASLFEPERGHKFSTYSTWWVRQHIQRAVFEQGRTIRLPVHLAEKVNKVTYTETELLKNLGRDPTLEEIVQKTGFTSFQVENILKFRNNMASLDAPVSNDWDSQEHFDLIPSDKDVVEDVDTNIIGEDVRKALSILTTRELEAVKLRFGLFGSDVNTLTDAGKKMGITRERVRQLEKQALQKLAKPLESYGEDFRSDGGEKGNRYSNKRMKQKPSVSSCARRNPNIYIEDFR